MSVRHVDLTGTDLHFARARTGTAAVTTITPSIAGEVYLKTDTGQVYLSTGTTTGSWVQQQLFQVTTAPATTPAQTGLFQLDDTNHILYVSRGTSSSADWHAIPLTNAAATFASVTATGAASGASLAATGTAGAGYVEVAQQSSTPSSPASGKDRVYTKTTSATLQIGSGGQIARVTSGSLEDLFAVEGSQKNYVFNSGFYFQQRGTGNNGGVQVFGLDRWWQSLDGTAASVSQQTTSYSGCQSKYCARLTAGSSGTTVVQLVQPNETASTAALIGKTVTLSCKVRKSTTTTGDFRLRIQTTTSEDDGGLAIANGTVPTNGSITVTNANLTTSFQTVTMTVAIPSTARSIGINLAFINPTASTYLEVTEVVLNAGSVAASWSHQGVTIGGELALCQRYFFKTFDLATAPANGVSFNGAFAGSVQTAGTSSSNFIHCRYPVAMRTAPTALTFYQPNSGAGTGQVGRGDGTSATSTTAVDIGQSALDIQYTGNSGWVLGNGVWVHLVASAEL